MSTLFPQKIIVFLALLSAVALVGCTHQKTQRGHLFRGDWAVEYNRTPWIGCPADSGCPDMEYQNVAQEPRSRGLFSCLTKDNEEKKQRGFRRHCAMNPGCTQKNPCCRTLGCGMWIEPENTNSTMPASLGGPARACGLTPFCFPNSPCRITPNCGKPANAAPGNVNSQTLSINNPQAYNGLNGRNIAIGNAGNAAMPGGMAINGMTVNGMPANGSSIIRGMSPNGVISADGGVIGAVPSGTLVSRGIVPGASAITSGGMVAAIGVATPAGTMTAAGVRLPNGMVNNNAVLRACVATPNCTAAHPCGLTPNCGGAVAINMVSGNAIALASALQAQGVASGVMQLGGMGTLVNPMTNQPINGVTMGGYTQAGYPPIGYATSGYSPGHPRYMAGMMGIVEDEEEEPEEEEEVVQETRSAMPVPRFHPIPTKPAFERRDGMAPTPEPVRQEPLRTVAKPATTAMLEQNGISEKEYEAALDRAYLEGVSAAMNDVERKLAEKRQAAATAQLQEKILRQVEYVQQQLDEQEQLQMLAMQRMQRERREPPTVSAQRLPPPQSVAAKTNTNANVNPLHMAESLKKSVASGVNGLLASDQRGSVAAKPLPQSTTKPKAEVVSQYEVPLKPPVSPKVPKYGLSSDDESESGILQAQFTADGAPMRP